MLDPVQVAAVDFVVAQEGEKKVEKVGGGGDVMVGTGKPVVLARRNDGII